jgi:uncharacterized damage-inducible protein DinB
MKKCILFLLWGLLNFPAFGQQGFIKDFQEKWSNSMDYTVEVAEAMPADKYDYQPTEDQMNFESQLLHMMSNINWLTTSYLNGEAVSFDLKSTDYSKERLIEMLKIAYGNAAAAVKELKEADLEEQVDFFAGPKSKRQIITLLNDHSTHHRGQLIVYMRLNNIKPPRYRGW